MGWGERKAEGGVWSGSGGQAGEKRGEGVEGRGRRVGVGVIVNLLYLLN